MKKRPLNWGTTLIYVNAFCVGIVLMGFEMLGSRYLFPYFGGGIGTWAGLISIVLCALAAGYFIGGILVDRNPSPHYVSTAVGISALYLACVPSTADHIIAWLLENAGGGALGIILASSALLLVPVTLLGMFTPMALRLQTRSTEQTGRIAGNVYGISTIGNVFGTLFTTFALIPEYGSRSITYIYALLLGICAMSLLIGSRKAP